MDFQIPSSRNYPNALSPIIKSARNTQPCLLGLFQNYFLSWWKGFFYKHWVLWLQKSRIRIKLHKQFQTFSSFLHYCCQMRIFVWTQYGSKISYLNLFNNRGVIIDSFTHNSLSHPFSIKSDWLPKTFVILQICRHRWLNSGRNRRLWNELCRLLVRLLKHHREFPINRNIFLLYYVIFSDATSV